jgi:phosphatidate cytidylyltransferase
MHRFMAETNPVPVSRAKVFFRRSVSTLGLWAVVAGVFVSRNGWFYLGLVTLLAVVAVVEYFRMLRKAGVPSHPFLGVGVSVLYGFVLGWFLVRGGQPPVAWEGVCVFLVTAGAFTWRLREPVKGKEPLIAVAVTLLGFVYASVLFQFLARIIFLDGGDAAVSGKVTDQGAFLLLWVIAVTKFTDTGAYLTGSVIGRHKMIPHISPAKTWEGFAGALVFAQLAGCGLYYFFPEALAVLGGYGHVVVLGVLLALLAVVGDLAESVVKRALDAKDSGHFLPGIGGSLDLIDSLCFTAPALFIYLQWVLR